VVKTGRFSRLELIVDNFEEEEVEFLLEMVEPEMQEGKQTLAIHQQEELVDVDDIETYMNNMSRQERRMKFLTELRKALERSNSD
jgi:hypothetical protein